MPDSEGHLYLFEALALRDEYDQRIALLQKLLDPDQDRRIATALRSRQCSSSFWRQFLLAATVGGPQWRADHHRLLANQARWQPQRHR